MKLNIIKS